WRSADCDSSAFFLVVFFFQAEDGIRDFHVTGVQTCALPISVLTSACLWHYTDWYIVLPGLAMLGGVMALRWLKLPVWALVLFMKIGRASCRERAAIWGGAGQSNKRESQPPHSVPECRGERHR